MNTFKGFDQAREFIQQLLNEGIVAKHIKIASCCTVNGNYVTVWHETCYSMVKNMQINYQIFKPIYRSEKHVEERATEFAQQYEHHWIHYVTINHTPHMMVWFISVQE